VVWLLEKILLSLYTSIGIYTLVALYPL
jgi:hypothetical protein